MTISKETESPSLDRLWRLLDRICGRFGHWLVNVEEGVARCRICRTLLFCGHATHEQVERWLFHERP